MPLPRNRHDQSLIDRKIKPEYIRGEIFQASLQVFISAEMSD
jgi:hypothetical protein